MRRQCDLVIELIFSGPRRDVSPNGEQDQWTERDAEHDPQQPCIDRARPGHDHHAEERRHHEQCQRPERRARGYAAARVGIDIRGAEPMRGCRFGSRGGGFRRLHIPEPPIGQTDAQPVGRCRRIVNDIELAAGGKDLDEPRRRIGTLENSQPFRRVKRIDQRRAAGGVVVAGRGVERAAQAAVDDRRSRGTGPRVPRIATPGSVPQISIPTRAAA